MGVGTAVAFLLPPPEGGGARALLFVLKVCFVIAFCFLFYSLRPPRDMELRTGFDFLNDRLLFFPPLLYPINYTPPFESDFNLLPGYVPEHSQAELIEVRHFVIPLDKVFSIACHNICGFISPSERNLC